MGGKIDCYLDIASLYSYLAFLELQKNKDLLASHNVKVDYHPVLLGAINAGSGNRPPWTLPFKARYGVHDARRAIARHNPPPTIAFPADLMKSGMTVLPLRCLHYIKRRHPRATFLAALHGLFEAFWAPPPNGGLTTVEGVRGALRGLSTHSRTGGNSGGERSGDGGLLLLLFTEGEVEEVLAAAGTEEMKGLLRRTTQEALEKGAFGAPWLWVRDGQGREEPFFGSDRFHFVYKFLGLPYTDVTLLPAGETKVRL